MHGEWTHTDKRHLLWSTGHPAARKLSVMWLFSEQMSIITDAVDRVDEQEYSRGAPTNYWPWDMNNISSTGHVCGGFQGAPRSQLIHQLSLRRMNSIVWRCRDLTEPGRKSNTGGAPMIVFHSRNYLLHSPGHMK